MRNGLQQFSINGLQQFSTIFNRHVDDVHCQWRCSGTMLGCPTHVDCLWISGLCNRTSSKVQGSRSKSTIQACVAREAFAKHCWLKNRHAPSTRKCRCHRHLPTQQRKCVQLAHVKMPKNTQTAWLGAMRRRCVQKNQYPQAWWCAHGELRHAYADKNVWEQAEGMLAGYGLRWDIKSGNHGRVDGFFADPDQVLFLFEACTNALFFGFTRVYDMTVTLYV